MTEEDYTAGSWGTVAGAALVVLSGCSGGGKSALLAEMSRRGHLVRPEPGRQIVKEQLSIGGDGLPWANTLRFIDLCVSRAMYFYNSARTEGRPVYFDRSLIDNIAGFAALGLPIPAEYRAAAERYRYAHTVYLVPPWEELFRPDTERRHTFETARAEYERLEVAYRDFGYVVTVVPKGTVAERADYLER